MLEEINEEDDSDCFADPRDARPRRDTAKKRKAELRLHKQGHVGSFLKAGPLTPEDEEQHPPPFPPPTPPAGRSPLLLKLSRFKKHDSTSLHFDKQLSSVSLMNTEGDERSITRKIQEMRDNLQGDIKGIKEQLSGFMDTFKKEIEGRKFLEILERGSPSASDNDLREHPHDRRLRFERR